MFEKIKNFTDRWFENQKNPQLRHEFPLYNINDNFFSTIKGEPGQENQNQVNIIQRHHEDNNQ
ncbi:hypothetical protein [Alkaliphilus crotonatoxidans]